MFSSSWASASPMLSPSWSISSLANVRAVAVEAAVRVVCLVDTEALRVNADKAVREVAKALLVDADEAVRLDADATILRAACSLLRSSNVWMRGITSSSDEQSESDEPTNISSRCIVLNKYIRLDYATVVDKTYTLC